MLRFIIILFFSSTLFSQVQTESWLDYVIEENKEAEPNIIPHNIESFKIRFGKITVGNPQIIEADGSRRAIFPSEARLRKISYSAPIFLEISSYINDVQRENFQAEIGKLPIMLRSKYCNLKDLSREELIHRAPYLVFLSSFGTYPVQAFFQVYQEHLRHHQ